MGEAVESAVCVRKTSALERLWLGAGRLASLPFRLWGEAFCPVPWNPSGVCKDKQQPFHDLSLIHIFVPPLVISREDVDEMACRLEAAIRCV